jgi:hypothetical protein
LGLGLAVGQRGARVNGGEITVLNHPGTGCVFTVDLPRQLPAVDLALKPTIAHRVRAAPQRRTTRPGLDIEGKP